MFGFDWPELIIIGIVALIFIGPEDLPDMFRQLGRFTAKLRQMSREFSRAMEQAAKDTGVADVARDLKTSTSVKGMGLDKVREAADKFEKWDPIKNAAKPSAPMPARTLTPPPMPAAMPMTQPQALTAAAPLEVTADEPGPDEVDEDIAAAAEADAALLHGPETHGPETHGPETHGPETHGPETHGPETHGPETHGPATQALYDKQALRARVLAEQTEKLKAIEAGTYVPEPARAEAVKAEAVKAEAVKAEAVKAEAVKAEAVKAEPLMAESATAEPAKPAPRKRVAKPKEEKAAQAAPKSPRNKKADNA